MNAGADRPRLLLVGGSGGLLGRALLPELVGRFSIRSVHRHPSETERADHVEWVSADITQISDWVPFLEGVDVVLNLAWYRAGSRRRFQGLAQALLRLLSASRAAGVRRFVQVSVPSAPERLEARLPYLVEKRRFDRALSSSGISYRIVRPTMMFGPNDVLLTVMLRSMSRYPFFPMFGDGSYHLSPIAVSDVARLIRQEADGSAQGTLDVGGPVRYSYRELTELLFAALGKPARYWNLSPSNGVRLARLLETVGSRLLYAYEVEWLMSDRLGLPAFEGLDRPLARVEPFIELQARILRGERAGRPGPPPGQA